MNVITPILDIFLCYMNVNDMGKIEMEKFIRLREIAEIALIIGEEIRGQAV